MLNSRATVISKNDTQLGSTVLDEPCQVDMLNVPIWSPPLVRGMHKILIGILIKFNVITIAIRLYINPLKVIKVIKQLELLRRQYMGDFKVKKLFKIHNRYYWDMHAPGWPSKAFTKYNEGEMNRIIHFRPISDYLNSMIFAITKKCPLQCQHCYEWDVINKKETLSTSDLKSIVLKFQNRGKGVAQIQFSGGEPLSRYEDILELLKIANTDTDFWIVTSGYHFTKEKARRLKSAGLKGIAVSLDHFNENQHNSFRGSKDSFSWVLKSIRHAHQVGLAVILSLCVTKEFTSEANLINYALFAQKLGAAFILLIEPRAVGKYAGKDVALTAEQENILDTFYLKMNYDSEFAEFPAVSYHAYHQRRVGCFGGTNRYIYVDTNGDIQVCPFCQKKYGNVLSELLNERMDLIQKNGCTPYKQAQC